MISDAGTLEFALLRVAGDYELVAKEYPVLPERDTILSLYFDVRRFLAVLEKFDESDRIYLDYDEERKFRIKIQCMDPSGCLKEVMERVQSTIFFSATLLPIRYYKEQLGGEKEDARGLCKIRIFAGTEKSDDCPRCDDQNIQGAGRQNTKRLRRILTVLSQQRREIICSFSRRTVLWMKL